MAEKVVQPGESIEYQNATEETSTARASWLASAGEAFWRGVDALWRVLRQPWLLLLVLVVVGWLLAWTRFVPQIPGQLLDSPAEKTRWVNSVAANWSGAIGSLARSLEVYHLFGNPLFVALVLFAALLAVVQIADAVGGLLAWRKVVRSFAEGEAGAPIALHGLGAARTRFAVDGERESIYQAVEQEVKALYAQVEAVIVAAAVVGEPASDGAAGNGASETQTKATVSDERRILGQRNGWSRWLRLLLPVAALIGVMTLWANMQWGWNVRTDALAPGAEFAARGQDLRITNLSGEEDGSADAPSVRLWYGGAESLLVADGRAQRVRDISVRATQADPAMIVGAAEPILAIPGAPQPQAEVGLVFPGLGTEQFVLLPDAGIGLRFVRITDGAEEYYFAEVYDEAAVQPVVRQRVDGASELVVPTDDGEITLEVTRAWSVTVAAERTFAAWAWIPLTLLGLAGVAALVRPARFLMAQVGVWEEARAQVIVQGSVRREVEGVREREAVS